MMKAAQANQFHGLVEAQETLTEKGVQYWSVYSGIDTWQFWVIVGMLILPLIVLYKLIDRKNIFLLGFFGFAAHVLFAYTDAFGIRYGLWGYPYQALPFLPSVSLDAALIPVTIMLVFQWTLNHRVNYHLAAFVTALFFGFGFKPLLVAIGLFEKYHWVNYFYIFLIYIVLFELAYWLTRLFMRMGRDARLSAAR